MNYREKQLLLTELYASKKTGDELLFLAFKMGADSRETEIDEIERELEKEFEKGQKVGYDDGYNDGYNDGDRKVN